MIFLFNPAKLVGKAGGQNNSDTLAVILLLILLPLLISLFKRSVHTLLDLAPATVESGQSVYIYYISPTYKNTSCLPIGAILKILSHAQLWLKYRLSCML